tara:strand:+ start:1965 stop:2594 length:630 start_codon:yes stop_codon:yes gene_type:complete
MPIDPATGARLPYPGEPGYDPAMAGAPPPGMPPEGMPPEGMPPEGMPPEGMPQDEMAPDLAQVAAQAPMPEKPFTIKALETLVKQFNDTVDKLSGGALPQVEVDFSGVDGKKWPDPLPPQIFVPLIAINEALKVIEDGKFHDKYGFDPLEVVTDVGVRKATAQLKRMAGDKKLAKALMEPTEESVEAASAPPSPGEFAEDDEALAEGLA